MQNTISDVRLQTEAVHKDSSASSRKNGVLTDAQLADPFMQIIMNMVAQYADSENAESPENGTAPTETAGIEGLQSVQNAQTLLNLQTLLSGVRSESTQQTGLADMLTGLDFSSSDVASQLSAILGAQVQGTESGIIGQMQDSSYWQLFQDVVESSMESGKTPDADTILQLLSNQGMDVLKNGVTDESLLTESVTQSGQTLAELLAAKLNGNESETTNVQQLISELKGLEESQSTSAPTAAVSESETQNPKDAFGAAVEKAKELISKQQPKAEETVPEAAETPVEPRTVTPFELRFKAAETVETPVAQQVETGIKENLALGKTEFTVKLNPESLGEITVKLVEEAGKTTLTITTASAQTAKLLNNDLDALKTAVAPLNVQVNEAVTHTEASQQGGMQQFDMAGEFAQQQQTSQQFAAQQSFLRASRGYSNDGEEQQPSYSIDPAAAALAMSAVSTGRLDAYI